MSPPTPTPHTPTGTGLSWRSKIYSTNQLTILSIYHDDVIKWKQIPRNWPFVRGIHRSPVNSPHKGQWRGALMFSLICVWINGWVNNGEAGDLRRYCAHCDVTVMTLTSFAYLESILHYSDSIIKHRQTSDISHTLVGNTIVDHSAAPTTSSFLASMDWAKTTARRDDWET